MGTVGLSTILFGRPPTEGSQAVAQRQAPTMPAQPEHVYKVSKLVPRRNRQDVKALDFSGGGNSTQILPLIFALNGTCPRKKKFCS